MIKTSALTEQWNNRLKLKTICNGINTDTVCRVISATKLVLNLATFQENHFENNLKLQSMILPGYVEPLHLAC